MQNKLDNLNMFMTLYWGCILSYPEHIQLMATSEMYLNVHMNNILELHTFICHNAVFGFIKFDTFCLK